MRERFTREFGRACSVIARAPGRVNLIGEHTDYNDGFVLPVALAESAWLALAPRTDGVIDALAANLNSRVQWNSDAWQRDAQPAWTAYIHGAARLLAARGGYPTGWDVLIHSDVPPGAGLASSAALTVASAFGMAFAEGDALEATELVDLCRQVEHDFADVPCGIMDQTASLQARAGHALLLDCRSRAVDHVPLRLERHALLVIDSGVRHALADGEYAKRRNECEAAAAYFHGLNPQLRALRDVTPQMARSQALQMDPTLAARAVHVTLENARTEQAAAALRKDDFATVGRLMNESHASLRDQFEVSYREVDELVERLQRTPGVLGARMTGAGFGGAVVVLAASNATPQIEAAVAALVARDGVTERSKRDGGAEAAARDGGAGLTTQDRVARSIRRVVPGDGARIVEG